MTSEHQWLSKIIPERLYQLCEDGINWRAFAKSEYITLGIYHHDKSLGGQVYLAHGFDGFN